MRKIVLPLRLFLAAVILVNYTAATGSASPQIPSAPPQQPGIQNLMAYGSFHPPAWDASQIVYSLQPLTNTAPVAADDVYLTDEDTPLIIAAPGVLTNDFDLDGDPLTSTLQTGPSQGLLTLNTDGSFSYSPALNFNGVDSFTYVASDVFTTSNTATVTITVTSVNDPPIANNDTTSTAEDTPVGINVTGNDNDVDGNLDPGSVTVLSGPSNGSTSTDPATGVVTYTSSLNYNGADSFTYQVCDTGLACASASVAVTISAVNDPPTTVNDSAITPEDTPIQINVLANDSDPEGNLNPASLSISSPASHGTTNIHPVQRRVTYSPSLNYFGPDAFSYQICDTLNACSIATASITVTLVNDPPVAVDDTATTPENSAVVVDILANDIDVDFNLEPASVTIITATLHGSTVVSPTTGAVTYTPNLNYNGSDSFTYQVCDTFAVCSSALVSISITAVNDPPVANSDTASTPEDTPVLIDVLANDSDPDGNLDPASVSIITTTLHGSASVNLITGAITYTPSLNYNGTDDFTYEVCDTLALCATAPVSISIAPVNDPPVANNDTASTPEDTLATIDVVANDSDPEGNLDPSTVTVINTAIHGSTTVDSSTGVITYTPTLNYNGADGFTYQVCDTQSACSSASVAITVTQVNDPPVANNDTASTPEDTPAIFNVIANDGDVDNNLNPASVTIITGTIHGSATVNPATGAVTYTPSLNYNGNDSFTYQVCDTQAACDSAFVSITVTPVNDPPSANNDTASTPEDTPVSIPVLTNDNDVDNNLDPTSVTVFSSPANGSTAVDSTTGVITYTPYLNYNGNDGFTYQVCDTQAACAAASVAIAVSPVNDPPVANNDSAATAQNIPVAIDVLANDSDVDNNLDPTSVNVITGTIHGLTAVNPATGVITYTPSLDYSGNDSFTYQVCDNQAACDSASVAIYIGLTNIPPLANDDTANTPEDTTVPIDVLANDSDPNGNLDPTSVTVLSAPTHGLASVDLTTGVVTYTPILNYNGSDDFTYQVCDLLLLCDSATVTINITPVNDPPVANDDTASTPEDTFTFISVLTNDSDPDNNLDPTSLTTITGTVHGSTTLNSATGVITYTPSLNYYGADSFTYQVCDDQAACASASVTISVTSVNDPPIANDDTANTPEDTSVSIDVLANDSDLDGSLNPASVSVTSLPSNGNTTVNPASGAITYTSNLNFYGQDSFVYQVCDNDSACDTATVSVTITSVNDLPVALHDAHMIFQDRTLSVTPPGVLINDSDADGDTITAVLSTTVSHGVLVLDLDGSFVYTPTNGYVGADSFTYQAFDGTGLSIPALVDIEVIDTVAPLVIWVAPVTNNGMYDGGPGSVELRVTATDNVGVNYVRFWTGNAVTIAIDYVSPYSAVIDTRSLPSGWNYIFAKAYDSAGNASTRQQIFIYGYYQPYSLFMPAVLR